MGIKKFLLIFLFGMISGLLVSPFASGTPQKAVKSPVSISVAKTSDLIAPVSEEEVLGANTSQEEIKNEIEYSELRPVKAIEISDNSGNWESGQLTTALEISKQKLANVASGSAQEKAEEATNSAKPKEKPISQPIITSRGSLTIAVLGDSMVDTMGPGLPYLDRALKRYYPNYNFNLLNYGAGGTNIEYGISRLTSTYSYLGKSVPALVSTHPDIVIAESFGYNPWGGEKADLDKHWLAMAKIVDILKAQTQAKILFLSTIAPNKANFGAGPAGVNWDKSQAWQHAEKINKYLENTVRFAASQNLPVVNAYHPSLANGDGNLSYINPGDHIHPNVAGCEFIAGLVAQKINNLGWIK